MRHFVALDAARMSQSANRAKRARMMVRYIGREYIDMAIRKLQVLSRITELGSNGNRKGRQRQPMPSASSRRARRAGLAAIEVTFTVPGAAAVDRGACEALSQRTRSRLAREPCSIRKRPASRFLAGAQFIVSPSLNRDTARLCNRYQIPYLPGAGTIGEIVEAMECGADIVKVFPGETLGPAFVKAALSSAARTLR